MIKKITGIIILLILFINGVNAYVSVGGYFKKDGTYVQSHVRSNPNGIKFDNYSWSSSQGLYNKTYGTRGIYWDTPTYITDTDYYKGLSIYNNFNSKENNNANTSKLNYGINNNKCLYKGKYFSKPNNSYCTNTNNLDAWLCNLGYIEDNGKCIREFSIKSDINNKCFYKGKYFIKPKNSSCAINSISDAWICNYGFIEIEGKCVIKGNISKKMDCGIGGRYNDSFGECFCNSGYGKGTDGKCKKMDCGIGGRYNDSFGECFCNSGYGKGIDGKCN